MEVETQLTSEGTQGWFSYTTYQWGNIGVVFMEVPVSDARLSSPVPEELAVHRTPVEGGIFRRRHQTVRDAGLDHRRCRYVYGPVVPLKATTAHGEFPITVNEPEGRPCGGEGETTEPVK